MFGGLFWKRGNSRGSLASIFIGETLVALYYLKVIPSPGLLSVVPIVGVSALVYILVSLSARDKRSNEDIVFPIEKGAVRTGGVFTLLLVLGHDLWRWGKSPLLFLGLPLWVWYFFVLGILLSVSFKLLLKTGEKGMLKL